jgi:hypothetical protein
MKITAFTALAAALLAAGCASTSQTLAYDPEGCVLNRLAPGSANASHGSGPWSNDKIRSGDPEFRTKANCTSNRALEQMAAARLDQQRNTTTSFSNETPDRPQ